MDMRNFTPLNSAFMAASIIGLVVSVLYIPALSATWKDAQTWSFAFGLIFLVMLAASILSMTRAPTTSQIKECLLKKEVKKKQKKKAK